MKCKQVQQKLVDYSEKLLDDKARSRIEEHLQKCSVCTQELHAIENTIAFLQALPFQDPPEAFWTDFTSKVMSTINKMPSPSKIQRLWYFPRVRMAMAFFVLIVILGGLYGYFHAEIQRVLHPVNITAAARSEQDSTLSGAPDTKHPIEKALHRIASDDLKHAMLEHDLALFEGSDAVSFDRDYSDEMVYFLINSLTEEEKEALLTELHKMKNTSQ
jgi:hypothetical protein